MSDDLESSTASHPSGHRPDLASNHPAPPATTGPYSATYPQAADVDYDDIHYGPDIATEAGLRLLGDLEGRRILVLGCSGTAPVVMARRGARVLVTDADDDAIAATREAAEANEVRLELHHGDLAELAFVRADSVDLVFSAYALAGVDDLDRVFRQAHRVLRPEQHLVFSLPHPAFSLIDPASGDPMRIRRAYWDETSRAWESEGRRGVDHPHTLSAVFSGLTRANFRVDTLLEPPPVEATERSPHWAEPMRWVPATLILRGRKEGI